MARRQRQMCIRDRVNHEDYFAKIGDDHKFPINKFGELANYLIQNKIVKKFHKPYACSLETLSYAHSKDYISKIKNKNLSKEEVKKIGFPLVDSVVQRSLVATGGTVLASKLAINYGISCNTAGGSHHANYNWSRIKRKNLRINWSRQSGYRSCKNWKSIWNASNGLE